MKAQERKRLQTSVSAWVRSVIGVLRKTADWQYWGKRFSGTSFDLTLSALFLPGYPGSTDSIGTYAPIATNSSLVSVVETALRRKLPKLVRSPADKRFLLFEKDLRAYRTSTLAEAIRHLEPRFPDLKRVDQVWHLDTSERARQQLIVCQKVWPDSEGIGFFVREAVETLSKTAKSGRERIP